MPVVQSRQETIYADLDRSLTMGEWGAGASLPSLRKLAVRYETSVGTVRTALTRLQYEGKVVAQHGSGYYVATQERPSLKTVLLIVRTQGDLWSEYFQLFTERLSTDPTVRVIIEQQPTDASLPALICKIEHYLDEGLEAIVFEGSHGCHLAALSAYRQRTRLICFGDDAVGGDWAHGKVLTDNFHGGYIGTRHLIDEGARRILMLFPHTYDLPECRNQQELHEGARQAVDEAAAGTTIRHLAVSSRHRSFVEQVGSDLAAHPGTDAIFSFCDFRFEHIVPELVRLGLRIPQDIGLLGYFDTPWCQRFQPELSSINIQPHKLVDSVNEMLHSGHDRAVMVRPVLVARGSTVRR